MKFDPESEIEYRIRLARDFLDEAGKMLDGGYLRGAVESSQLSAENSGKSIIAIHAVPSWSHDPSFELLDLKEKFPNDLHREIERLAEIVHELAPEHGRVSYGEPQRRIAPWEIYDKSYAEKKYNLSKEALGIAEEVLRRSKFSDLAE